MKKLFNILVIVLALSCLFLTACASFPNVDAIKSEESTVGTRPNDSEDDSSSITEDEDSSSSSDSSGGNEEVDKPLRVIFFGNSLMFFNDMPSLFKNLAEKSGKEIYVDSVTRGSATISDFANSTTDVGSQAYRKLQTQSWDYVIIEPSRRITPYENTVFEAELAAAKVMQRLATNAGAEILLYCVWGNNDGTLTEYNASNPIAMVKGKVHYDYTRKDHVAFLRTVSERISQALGGVGIIDAGYAFENSIAEYPSINLYDTDERHPSLEGSYLAAATVYATIYGQSPENIGFTGGSVLYFEMQRMAAATVIGGRIPDLSNDTEEIEQVDDPTKYDILFIGSDLVDNYDATTALASMINLSEGLTLNLKYMTNSTGVLNRYAVDGGDYLLKDTLARTKFDAIVLQITRRCTPTGTDVEASELAALKKIYPTLAENTANIYLYTFNGQSNPSIFTTANGDDSYTKTDASESLTVAQMNEYYTSIAKSWAEEAGCKYILQGAAWTAASPASDSAKGYVRALALYYGIFDKQVPSGVNTNGVEESVKKALEEAVAPYCMPSYKPEGGEENPELPDYATYDVLVVGTAILDNYDLTTSFASMVQEGQGKELYLEYVTDSVGVMNLLRESTLSSYYTKSKDALNSRKWDAVVVQMSRRCTPSAPAVAESELAALKEFYSLVSKNTTNLYILTFNGQDNPSIFTTEGGTNEYTKTDSKESLTAKQMDSYYASLASAWAEEIGCKYILQGTAWTEVNPQTDAERGYVRACALYNGIFDAEVPEGINTNGVEQARATQIEERVVKYCMASYEAPVIPELPNPESYDVLVIGSKLIDNLNITTSLASMVQIGQNKELYLEYVTDNVGVFNKIASKDSSDEFYADYKEAIQSRKWDAIVLQISRRCTPGSAVELSELNAIKAILPELKANTSNLFLVTLEATENPNIFLNEGIEYAKSSYKVSATVAEMTAYFNGLASSCAEEIGAKAILHGAAWVEANPANNAEKAYLRACCLYNVIFASRVPATADTNGVSAEVASSLRRIALNYWLEKTPADLTALNGAIATAEGKVEGEYTTNSWNALQAILAEAKLLTGASDQEEIDATVLLLNEAIDALVLKADLSLLTALIAEVEALNEESYTPNSFALLTAPLAAAKALSGDNTQEAVNGAYNALNEAKQALVLRADFTALNSAIATARGKVELNYTQASWQLLASALSEAEALDFNATQEEVNAKATALNEAIEGLIVKADLTALNEAIAIAEGKVEGEYTVASWAVLKEALASAKLLDEGSDSVVIANATVALNSAIAGLVLKANLTELNELLGEIALLEKDAYTEESWQALQDEIALANSLNSESAQAEVDAVVASIRNAKGALEEKVETDLSQLTLLLTEIELLDERNYTLASWTALEDSIAGADEITKENTQEEVNQAVSVILAAKQALVLIPTYETYDILFIGSDLIEDEYIAVSLSSMISLGKSQELHLEYVTDGVGVINRLVYREDESNNDDLYSRTRAALNARRWDSIIIQFSRRATPESTVANSELAALKAIYPTLTRNCEDIYIFTLNGSSTATIFNPEGVSYTSTGEKSTLSAADMGTYYQTVVEQWCAELGCKSILYGSAYNEMAPSTSKAKGFMRALCIYYSIFNEEMPSGADVQGTSSSGVKKIKAAAAKYCLG